MWSPETENHATLVWNVWQRTRHGLKQVILMCHWNSVVVLVLKESLRTKFKTWSWSLYESPCVCPCGGNVKRLKNLSTVLFWSRASIAVTYLSLTLTGELLLLLVSRGPDFNPEGLPLESVWQQYRLIRPLLSKIFCTPATSAPVERVFSRSGSWSHTAHAWATQSWRH